MDLTATILAAAGAGAPPGHRPEGIDLLPILRGDSALADRQLFWRIARPNRQQRAVRSGQWKLLVDGGQFLLFDLRADPGEKHDLTAQRPELVVKLKTLLEAWEKDVDQKPQTNQ
jgi:arylsulfatase A-like enzyme